MVLSSSLAFPVLPPALLCHRKKEKKKKRLCPSVCLSVCLLKFQIRKYQLRLQPSSLKKDDFLSCAAEALLGLVAFSSSEIQLLQFLVALPSLQCAENWPPFSGGLTSDVIEKKKKILCYKIFSSINFGITNPPVPIS